MKKMSMVCMMTLCLAMPGFPTTPLSRDWERMKVNDRKTFDRIWQEYNDPVKLKRRFEDSLLIYPLDEKEMEDIKQAFGLKEETLRDLLMGFIREASAKTGWKQYSMPEPEDLHRASWQLREAIRWLSVCADAEVKQFLMGIATDNEKHDSYRNAAVLSYLIRADVLEIRDAIVRLLADDMRALNRYGSMYYLAIKAYDKTEGDTQTREAIVAAMSAALAKEEDKKIFTNADKRFAELSKEYAESPQRKAALERMNKPPEEKTP